MKKTKNYIEAELAKKKTARYKYWSIKDENGITILSSDDENDNRSFDEVLDKIIEDNVDAEVQVKYGTNEQSSRNNPPYFIRINEEIEWVEAEEETVNVNGVPHKLDKNGNVSINLNTPAPVEPKVERAVPIDTFRQEMEIQLNGIRREHELKEEKMLLEMQNKMMEQNLNFKEMMLSEREARLLEREQACVQHENQIEEKKNEIQEDVKGYLKQVPKALGGLIKEFVKDSGKKKATGLSGAETTTKKKKRKKVQFNFEEKPTGSVENEVEEEMTEAELEAIIAEEERLEEEALAIENSNENIEQVAEEEEQEEFYEEFTEEETTGNTNHNTEDNENI
jgi:S-DNA-T family DNA segregation ATPase FtsK/SpoIIIE